MRLGLQGLLELMLIIVVQECEKALQWPFLGESRRVLVRKVFPRDRRLQKGMAGQS
jgi:hypothetical protein